MAINKGNKGNKGNNTQGQGTQQHDAKGHPVQPQAAALAQANATEHFTYTGTTADGQPVVLVHVMRRRYHVYIAGTFAGYVTAATAVNAINRANAYTAQTMRLH